MTTVSFEKKVCGNCRGYKFVGNYPHRIPCNVCKSKGFIVVSTITLEDKEATTDETTK